MNVPTIDGNDNGQTHWETCGLSGPRHYECLKMRAIALLKEAQQYVDPHSPTGARIRAFIEGNADGS